jgi:hypothetical protein
MFCKHLQLVRGGGGSVCCIILFSYSEGSYDACELIQHEPERVSIMCRSI